MAKEHHIVTELKRINREGTPPEVKQQYQELLRHMERGLPPATSAEVLGRRCTF